jgi:DHA2 family multidrug resistance protein-like MFS transporter
MAILGSIGTASYRRIMAENLSGVSIEIAESARSTLGAAIATADQLGGQAGAGLAATARNAFAQSLEVVAAIAAVMVLIMGIAVVALLKSVTPSPAAGESDFSAAA